MKKVLVYSALHTGTWFVCDALTNCSAEHTDLRTDAWFRNKYGKIIEDLAWNTSYEFECHLNLPDNPEHDAIVLQAHQVSDSYLFRTLLHRKLEVPIVVPFRDPLLSLNTRIWRETKNIDTLQQKETIKRRQVRAVDHTETLLRIIKIPNNHIFLLPIDINYTLEQRRSKLTAMLEYSDLTPDKKTIEETANTWPVINTTKSSDDNTFKDIKQAIIDKDINFVSKHIELELDILREMLVPYISRIKAMGYEDLIWW